MVNTEKTREGWEERERERKKKKEGEEEVYKRTNEVTHHVTTGEVAAWTNRHRLHCHV